MGKTLPAYLKHYKFNYTAHFRAVFYFLTSPCTNPSYKIIVTRTNLSGNVILNKINPKKLLKSKWTSVNPINKEKHFLITKVEFDEEMEVTLCILEAVLSNRESEICWQDLKDDDQWLQGWK